MSTLVVPNVFAGDATIGVEKMQGNFDAIRDYLNAKSGGIDASNLSSSFKLLPTQLAEPRSISIVNMTWVAASLNYRLMMLREAAELVAVGVGIRRASGGGPDTAGFQLDALGGGGFPGVRQRFGFQQDQSVTGGYPGWGYVPVGKTFGAGSILRMLPSGVSAGVGQVFAKLVLASQHINR